MRRDFPQGAPTRRYSAGFSLLEAMIVVAILGVLYTFVSPGYQQHLLRSNRTEGHALLVDAAARQERHYAQHNRYITAQAAIGELRLRDTQGEHVTSRSGLYRLLVEPGTQGNGGYLLTAVPLGAQRSDSACGSLYLDGNGTNGSTGTGSVIECWK